MCSLVHEPAHNYKNLYNHYINTLTHEHAYKMNLIHSLNAYKFTNTHGHTSTCSHVQSHRLTHTLICLYKHTHRFIHTHRTHSYMLIFTHWYFLLLMYINTHTNTDIYSVTHMWIPISTWLYTLVLTHWITHMYLQTLSHIYSYI